MSTILMDSIVQLMTADCARTRGDVASFQNRLAVPRDVAANPQRWPTHYHRQWSVPRTPNDESFDHMLAPALTKLMGKTL
jgi:hypothetical protein